MAEKTGMVHKLRPTPLLYNLLTILGGCAFLEVVHIFFIGWREFVNIFGKGGRWWIVCVAALVIVALNSVYTILKIYFLIKCKISDFFLIF